MLSTYKFDSILGIGYAGIVFMLTKGSESFALKVQCPDKQELHIFMEISALVKHSQLLNNFISLNDYGLIDIDEFNRLIPDNLTTNEDYNYMMSKYRDSKCDSSSTRVILSFIIMELIDGPILSYLNYGIDEYLLFEIVFGITALLSYNIIPGDLGPENIGIKFTRESICYIFDDCCLTIPGGRNMIKFIDYAAYRDENVNIYKLKASDVNQYYDISNFSRYLDPNSKAAQFLEYYMSHLDQPIISVLTQLAKSVLKCGSCNDCIKAFSEKANQKPDKTLYF